MSIAEILETEEREGLEPDAAERTANLANSTNKKEVHRTTVCWAHAVTMCVFTILQSILLFNIKLQLNMVTKSHLFDSYEAKLCVQKLKQ